MGNLICPNCYGQEGKRVVMELRDGSKDELQVDDSFAGPVEAEATKAEQYGNYWKCPVCGYQANE